MTTQINTQKSSDNMFNDNGNDKSNYTYFESKEDNTHKAINSFPPSNIVDEISEKNKIVNIKLDVIDRIISMYPQLKKDKIFIINKILCKKDVKDDNYVLDKFIYNNIDYYRDQYGYILNSNATVVGCCYTSTVGTNIYEYMFHSYSKYNIDDKLDFIKQLC